MEALRPVRSAEDDIWITVDNPAVAGTARRMASEMAERIGLGDERVAEVGLAATEAVANLDRHADGGRLVLRVVHQDSEAGLEMVAVDVGPGMGDPGSAAADGYSTTGTLGVGIGTIERLASSTQTWSMPGQGTVMVAEFWSRTVPAPWPVSGLTRAMTGQAECGDAWSARPIDGGVQLLLVDGLGHGAMAAIAAQEAVRLFADAPEGGPEPVLQHLHAGLHHTRGVVAAVVELDTGKGRATTCGVGNIRAVLDLGESTRELVSLPGILGHEVRRFMPVVHDLAEEALIVMHSDGLSDRWGLKDYPGLRRRSPLAIAAVLVRDAGGRRDDASVLVAKVEEVGS